MKNNFILPTLLLSTGITLAQHNHSAEHTSEATHLGHADHDQYTAPIGVMGAHNHEKGKWMFSYRYMYMSMDDNYDGSDTVSDQQVLQDFMVTPTDMNMEMHMFGAMYGVTDKLTIMGMVNYVNLEMSHLTRMGGTFTTRSQGLGDSSINAIYNFHSGESSQALAGLGIGLPTAKTDREDFIPAVGRNTTLPFPMQLGSGRPLRRFCYGKPLEFLLRQPAA